MRPLRGGPCGLVAVLLAVAACSPRAPAKVASPRALEVPRPARGAPAAPTARPGVLAVGECRCWRGRVSGNDPGVVAHLYLCRKGELLSGTARYDSPRSGSSVRDVSGRVGPQESTLLLRDDRIVQDRAAAGWRFCLVDAYELNLDPKTGALAGSYRSADCRDYALLLLPPTTRARCLLSALRREGPSGNK